MRIVAVALALLAGAIAAAGCGGGDEADPFAYARDAPLAIRVLDEQVGGGVEILDTSFAAAGGRVHAWVLVSDAPGPLPVVLFQHGGGSSRDDFLQEAAAVVERGAAAVLVQAPERPSTRAGIVANVVAWRRVLDWVETRTRLDARRIAYVGISYGAAVGAVLAGADDRVATFVLLSGPPRWHGARVADLEPEDWIGRSDARFLFQVGTADDVVPPEDAEALYEAAPEPKEIRRYDAGHLLNAEAQRERVAWLSRVLGLG